MVESLREAFGVDVSAASSSGRGFRGSEASGFVKGAELTSIDQRRWDARDPTVRQAISRGDWEN